MSCLVDALFAVASIGGMMVDFPPCDMINHGAYQHLQHRPIRPASDIADPSSGRSSSTSSSLGRYCDEIFLRVVSAFPHDMSKVTKFSGY